MGERKVRVQDEELSSAITDALEKLNTEENEEVELSLDDNEDDKLNEIEEENGKIRHFYGTVDWGNSNNVGLSVFNIRR